MHLNNLDPIVMSNYNIEWLIDNVFLDDTVRLNCYNRWHYLDLIQSPF